MTLQETKVQLHVLCEAYVNERLHRTQSAMTDAQAAANNESKSSAGDKYETGRAMMHLEKEKLSTQLAEILKLKKVVDQLKPDILFEKVALGSLVETDQGFFYLSIGAGKLHFMGKDYFAIAPTAPIGQRLIGLTIGEKTTFNGRTFVVKDLA